MEGIVKKRAIVTGAAQGLGYAMAEALCEEGAEVCIVDISPTLQEVVNKLTDKGYFVHGVQADLAELENISSYFYEAFDKLGGKIDILVNNAGIHKPLPALELNVMDFQSVLNVNVAAVFELAKLAATEMKKQQYGKIINIASVLAVQGGYNATAYSASKGAVLQLTKSLSNEWMKDGINVNAIAPGYYNTELNTHILNDQDRYDDLVSRVPANRFGEPHELGGTVKFLASKHSDFISGALIPVDGGFLGR